MANRLTMAEIDSILTLHTTGHSNREIADLLEVNRETVGKYVAGAKAQNQPNAPTGTEGGSGDVPPSADQNQPNAPTGDCRKRDRQNPSDRPLPTRDQEEITKTIPTIHWLVLTRPSVAGINAPRDTRAEQMSQSNTHRPQCIHPRVDQTTTVGAGGLVVVASHDPMRGAATLDVVATIFWMSTGGHETEMIGSYLPIGLRPYVAENSVDVNKVWRPIRTRGRDVTTRSPLSMRSAPAAGRGLSGTVLCTITWRHKLFAHADFRGSPKTRIAV